MQRSMLLAVPLLTAIFAPSAYAEDKKAEWQISAWGGEQHLRVDRDLHFRGESTRLDMRNNGIRLLLNENGGRVFERN